MNVNVDQSFAGQRIEDARFRSLPQAKPRLSIFGLGYVGAVSAGCFSDLAFEVVGVDPDQGKIAMIERGRSPIVEPGLDELLGRGRLKGLVGASGQAAAAVHDSEATMICVGTPTGDDGQVDFRYLDETCRQIGSALRSKSSYHLVIVRSTVPPGTTLGRLRGILEAASGKACGHDFGLCFNPEFLRESTAVNDFYDPPKTVIGAFDERSGSAAARLYEDVDDGVIVTSVEAAEMVKYVDNAWHALKVSFGNEVGRLCKASGIDSHEVMRIFVRDLKLNLSDYYLRPGFAFGGSCLPKDVRGIADQARGLGIDAPLLNSILPSNHAQIDHALALVESLPGRVGFLGLTFKTNTDDLRESPMLELMAALRRKGRQVAAYDPNLSPGEPLRGLGDYLRHALEDVAGLLEDLPGLLAPNADRLAADCDVLVVAHASEEFRRLAAERRPDQHVVDLVRLGGDLGAPATYHGICW